MKPILLTLMSFILFKLLSFAQTDTTITYLNALGKATISKDSAIVYTRAFKNNNLWHGKTYFIKTGLLASEGDYAEKECHTPVGTFDNYKEDGTLDNKSSYDNDGKLLNKTYYYKNGQKKSYIAYSNNGIKEQKGWDEEGKEIRGYIVEQEARFKGGQQAWIKYLQKNLNSNVAVESGAPAGDYVVIVSFLVNKEGYISEVKAIQAPKDCKACAAEAVSVVMNGPQWEPAIQNNVPVIYRQKQSITFQVREAGKKRGKD